MIDGSSSGSAVGEAALVAETPGNKRPYADFVNSAAGDVIPLAADISVEAKPSPNTSSATTKALSSTSKHAKKELTGASTDTAANAKLNASLVQTYMPDFMTPIRVIVKYDPFHTPNIHNLQSDFGIIYGDRLFGEVFGLTIDDQNFQLAYYSAGPPALNMPLKKMINFSQITGKMTDLLTIGRLKDAVLQMSHFQEFVNLHRIIKKDGMSVLPCHIRYVPIRGSAAHDEKKRNDIQTAHDNLSKGLPAGVTNDPSALFKATEIIGLLVIRSATSIGVSKAIGNSDDTDVDVTFTKPHNKMSDRTLDEMTMVLNNEFLLQLNGGSSGAGNSEGPELGLDLGTADEPDVLPA